jgi:hypothetical protein
MIITQADLAKMFKNANNLCQTQLWRNVTGFFPGGKFFPINELPQVAGEIRKHGHEKWDFGDSPTAITIFETNLGNGYDSGFGGFPQPIWIRAPRRPQPTYRYCLIDLSQMNPGQTAMMYRMNGGNVEYLRVLHRKSKEMFYIAYYEKVELVVGNGQTRSIIELEPTF